MLYNFELALNFKRNCEPHQFYQKKRKHLEFTIIDNYCKIVRLIRRFVVSRNKTMENLSLPNMVNEHTKLCRICLATSDELYSIHGFGKICDKTVKINDLLSECTSIEVSGIIS